MYITEKQVQAQNCVNKLANKLAPQIKDLLDLHIDDIDKLDGDKHSKDYLSGKQQDIAHKWRR